MIVKMNIKGLQELIEMELPVMRNTFLFRNLSEIPKSLMDTYGDKPKWIIRGFDDRQNITDNPYEFLEERILGFKREELKRIFNKLNIKLNKRNLPKQNRIYFVCEVFTDEDVAFSGFALKDTHNSYHNIYIDIYEGNRLSRKDSNPDISFKIPLIGEKPSFLSTPKLKYKNYAASICKDLMLFEKDPYVDFSCLKEGYFFYHDLGYLKVPSIN